MEQLRDENALLTEQIRQQAGRPVRLIVAVTAFLWGFMGASERGTGLGLPVH